MGLAVSGGGVSNHQLHQLCVNGNFTLVVSTVAKEPNSCMVYL